MAAALANEFGGGLIPEITGGFRLGDVRHIVASPAAAEQGLGFRAQVGFGEGIAEFAQAAGLQFPQRQRDRPDPGRVLRTTGAELTTAAAVSLGGRFLEG